MEGNYKSRLERRQQKSSKKKQTKKPKKIFKTVLLSLIIFACIGLIFGTTTFIIYAKDAPPLDKALLIDPVASEVLDKNGDVFAVLGTENRDYVEYDQIPKEVEDAVLATEDVRFYKHGGLDLRRLAGAVLANVSRGFGSEGASTLTQQVVKRSFLSDEKTLKRKAQEAWLAIKLEREYSKQQIFEIYVNKIYYANGVHGIETASKYYFGKELNELELQERAFLAGLPQSPNNFDPYAHPDKAEKRKNIVLSLMYQHKKISKAEMEKAQKIPITKTLIPQEKNESTRYKYDSYVDQVIREVESMGDYNVYADGLKIYTNLDPDAQEYTEKMLFSDEIVQFPDEKMQAGIVLLDTKTGEIQAIGGNRYKDVKRGKNYATQLTDRQPGSTAKPILDYGPAIEYLNWSTYEQIVDEPYQYSTGESINNYDSGYLGQMSIREALYRSRNIPALKAFQEVGMDKVQEFAEKVGLDPKSIEGESASIGGFTNISPLKLAAAYATFGNSGMYNKPHTVKKIVLRDGETEIKNKVSPQLAMKDSTAYMVTDMLKDVISTKAGATGSSAMIPGLPAAGKTGTTNYTPDEISKYGLNKQDVPDAWFAGYTTNYTIAVWTGYEQRKNPLRYGTNDQQLAKQLYKNLMAHVSEGIETPDFTMPNSVVKAAVEKGSNPAKKPSSYTPKDRIIYELFVAGTEPKEISQSYDKLDNPKVSGEYNKEKNEVVFTWSHSKAKQFDVTIKLANGKKQSLGQTEDTSYVISDVEPESTYSIEVKAILENQKSSAGTASVTVPKVEEEEEEEEEATEEETDNEQIDEAEDENKTENKAPDEQEENNEQAPGDEQQQTDNNKEDNQNKEENKQNEGDKNNKQTEGENNQQTDENKQNPPANNETDKPRSEPTNSGQQDISNDEQE